MNSPIPFPFPEADLLTSVPARFQRMLKGLPPDHLAYVSTDEALSYRALGAASRGLATALVARFGAAGSRAEQKAVALLLPHSSAPLTAILGVLEAGHFYIPLDFVMGEATLRHILVDCPPQVIVTTTALCDRLAALLPTDQKPPVLCIDTIPPDSTLFPGLPSYDGQMVASIQYTSGSTGRPRGVIRTHAMGLHSSYLACHDLGFTPFARVSHLLSYTHSISTPSIFGGLLNGATLHTQPPADISPPRLYQWIEERQITNLSVSIGLLRSLSELAETYAPLTSLRSIGTGGEVMKRAEVERLCRLLPASCKLVVRLASTEAGTYARFIIEAGKPWPGDLTPAGYAPLGQQVMIVDEKQQPLAAGQVGEIAVRGRFLCAGYWQRPAETAAKLLPDPEDRQQQIFLTGDVGRMSADGLVEHLGRKDFMVKIRGHRVQLEEVEAALCRLPEIAEAVVTARATSVGEQQLIAYYTPTTYPPPNASALRTALLPQLPDYMAPARFVLLEKLPRNAIGKIDRAALPPPGAARPALVTPFVAPRNELEQQIADIWAELLELDEVGIADNFFELGGDSLTLLRMNLLVEQRLKRSIPTAYYRLPTIRYMTQILSEGSLVNPAIDDSEVGDAHKQSWRERHRPDNSFKARFTNALWQRGPMYHGWALPYASGTALQRSLLRQPLIQRRFFGQESATFRQYLSDAGLATAQVEDMTLHLMANTWRTWRTQALQSPTTFARWGTVAGSEFIIDAANKGQGLIVVFAHQVFVTKLTRQLLANRGLTDVPVISRQNADPHMLTREVRRMQSARHGLEVLQRGGAILIAGEGMGATKPLFVPNHGRQLPLPRGFAELSLHSGAAIVAAFLTMSLAGKVCLEFVPLPTPTADSAIDDLILYYGGLLVERWPQLLPTMLWQRVQYLTSLPPTSPKTA